MSSNHYSVLLNESIRMLLLRPDGVYVDATFGRGGHSKEILSHLNSDGRLIALDRDPEAKEYAEKHFTTYLNFTFYQTTISSLSHVLEQIPIDQIDGILMDIGVSSPQLDTAERGFSFMKDGPLDMRMDPGQGISAQEWIMTSSYDDMVRVFREYGEERFASKIARRIIAKRDEFLIDTTLKLANIIAEAVPYKDPHKHPATRVFQAIRIEINNELNELKQGLYSAYKALKIGGRMIIISFHSLEDRVVKQFMQERAKPKDLFPELPVEFKRIEPTLKIIGKPVKAGTVECGINIRSRSAVMRVAEKIG